MSLQTRLGALITAIGADIKALYAGKVDTSDARLSDAREWSADTVSQLEAEAGTSTTRRAWTAQRVRQAIAAWWDSVSTAAGRALVGAADAAAQRATLGISNHNLITVDATGNVGIVAGKSLTGAGSASGAFSISPATSTGGILITGSTASGSAFYDQDAAPLDGTSGAAIRYFRNTNTTGVAYVDIFFGDGSSSLNHRLFGKGGASYLCRANGNLLVGKNTDDGTYKLQVKGSLTASGPVSVGQYTLSTLPSAPVFAGALIDVTNATGGPKTCRSDGTNWKILNTTTTVS